MNLRKFIKNRGVLTIWFISYISILLVPIFINVGIYNIYQRTMEEEISKANMALLKQVQTLIDTRISEIEKLAMEIGLNTRVKIAVNAKEKFLPRDQMNLYKVVQDFKVYKASSNFIDGCFLYIHNTNSAIEAGSHMSEELLYRFYFDRMMTDFNKWKEYIRQRHQRTVVPIKKKDINNSYYNALAYMQSIPIESPSECLGTIIITINEDKLNQIIKNINWIEQGRVLILDQNNTVLMSAGSAKLQDLIPYQDLEKGISLKRINIDGEEVAVASISSEVMPWKYVTIVPSKIFWQKARDMRQFIWFGILGCIVLGGVVAYFFTRLNYIPIKNIVKAFAYRYSFDESCYEYKNEYKFIQGAINSILQLQDKMEDRISHQDKVLRTNFLVRLLKGELQEEFLDQIDFPAYGISFDGKDFIVVLFYLNSYGYSYELSQFILQNVFEEIINRELKGYMVEVDEMMACIINGTGNTEEEMLDFLESAINQTKEMLQNEFNISIMTTVSNIHSSLIGISQAYAEAFNAMEYRMILDSRDSEDIVYYRHIQNPQKKYVYSIEMEQKLMNNIKIGDYSNSKKLLDEIFHLQYSNGSMSTEMSRCLIFDLASTLIKTIDSYADDFLEHLKPVERLARLNNLQEMKQELYAILQEVCDYVSKQMKNQNLGALEEKVKDFIFENYSDKVLNVSMLGDKFNMTPTYLSKLFKNYTGKSLLDFINMVRIEKAKELLEQEELTVAQVAEMVGFSNSNAFIRVFKKYEGITPGKYKSTI